jgi:ubiquinone/menaquinone biosynthesis C-methylase UbiE
MFLIELAKRLPQGKAYGVDLWLSKDQSGNKMDQTLTNAKESKVEERVELQTADIRSLPYPDGTFDAVVSSLVIHNIPDEEGRNQALSEILRVLKPGGKFTLLDIRNGVQYARFINQTKVGKANYSNLILSYCPFLRVVEGTKEN